MHNSICLQCDYNVITKLDTHMFKTVREVDYRISYKTEFFLPKQSKKKDPSYKTDLDLWDCLGKVKLV